MKPQIIWVRFIVIAHPGYHYRPALHDDLAAGDPWKGPEAAVSCRIQSASPSDGPTPSSCPESETHPCRSVMS
ncbi:hypothetical protein GCM10009853_032310 [Glycomyces scopariae]